MTIALYDTYWLRTDLTKERIQQAVQLIQNSEKQKMWSRATTKTFIDCNKSRYGVSSVVEDHDFALTIIVAAHQNSDSCMQQRRPMSTFAVYLTEKSMAKADVAASNIYVICVQCTVHCIRSHKSKTVRC